MYKHFQLFLLIALFQGVLGLNDYTAPVKIFYGLYRIRKDKGIYTYL